MSPKAADLAAACRFLFPVRAVGFGRAQASALAHRVCWIDPVSMPAEAARTFPWVTFLSRFTGKAKRQTRPGRHIPGESPRSSMSISFTHPQRQSALFELLGGRYRAMDTQSRPQRLPRLWLDLPRQTPGPIPPCVGGRPQLVDRGCGAPADGRDCISSSQYTKRPQSALNHSGLPLILGDRSG
jgi:hypothetical protein